MDYAPFPLIDLSGESPATLAMYGVDKDKPSFARNCLLARRLVERGTRFVQLYHTNWDSHGGPGENLQGDFEKVCREVDQGSAALVRDLKQRGCSRTRSSFGAANSVALPWAKTATPPDATITSTPSPSGSPAAA